LGEGGRFWGVFAKVAKWVLFGGAWGCFLFSAKVYTPNNHDEGNKHLLTIKKTSKRKRKEKHKQQTPGRR